MLKEGIITAKRIKITTACFVVFSAGLIAYVIGINLSRIGKVAVEIKYAPFEASVFIDDQNYSVNDAINYLEPGTHHVMVALDGFKTLYQDVEVTEDTKYLYGKLEPLDENDLELYQKYQSDYATVEGIGGSEAEANAQLQKDQYSILAYLPYIKDNYAIGTLFDDDGNLVVTVHANPVQINNAVDKLLSFGVNSSDGYKVVINDFKNELEGAFIDNDNSDPVIFLEDGYRGLNIPYQVNDGQRTDDYYYTTISVGKYAGYIPVNYRVILHKVGNSWEIVGTPYPVLTKYNIPDVDSSIIDLANSLEAPITVQPDSSGDGH